MTYEGKKLPGTPKQLVHRRELVTALRSGKYLQTRNRLKCGEPMGDTEVMGGMCCLGVACEISGLGQWVEIGGGIRPGPVYLGARDWLPPAVADWVGFTMQGDFCETGSVEVDGNWCSSLSELNDQGWSFDQIADFIEERWEVAPVGTPAGDSK